MSSAIAYSGELSNLSRMRIARSYRVSLVRETASPSLPSITLRLPIDAAIAARAFLEADLDREVFDILLLNTRNRVIGHNRISMGSLNGSLVHPREVFKAAILGSAAGIVCFHNHPSGDVSPSNEDRQLTTRLKQAGSVLGIEVLDHVILGDSPAELGFSGEVLDQTFFSFRARGEI